MNWCYDERYVDKKVKLFKVSRGYDELIQRLDIERVIDNKYLPCEIVSTAIDVIDYLLYDKANTAADNNDNETVIDITMTDRTKGDWTVLDDNKLHNLITGNNPVDIVEEYKNLDNLYMNKNNIMCLEKNDLCKRKTRFLYND